MINYKQATRTETGFFPILRKLTYVVLCLFSLHASGHYMRDSIAGEAVLFVAKGTTVVNLTESEDFTIRNQNTESIVPKPIVYITKGTTIVNLPASENYDIVYQNVKTASNDISSRQSTVKKRKQRISTVLKQKSLGKVNPPIWIFKNIPSKDTYEKHQNSMASFVIPNYHQLDKKCKNGIFNSVFICFASSYSENIIVKNILAQRQFYNFESFFARPPPM